jgi:hypothetical protein
MDLPEMFMYEYFSELCFLGFKDDSKTPHKVHTENLVYQAGMALYDYIAHDCLLLARSLADIDRPLEKMQLLENFDPHEDVVAGAYLASDATDYLAQNVNLRAFIRKLIANRRNRAAPVRLPMCIYLPIICIDSPLFSVESTETEVVGQFAEKPFLMTSVRYSWPQAVERTLPVKHLESLVIVTTVSSLKQVLEEIVLWFSGMIGRIERVGTRRIQQELLVAHVYRYLKQVGLPESDDSEWE